MRIRSRAKWLQDGEKVRSFCNLESRNYTSKSMAFLERDDGTAIFDQKEILEEVKHFYETLYSHRDMLEVDLKETLPDTPILSHEDKERINLLRTVNGTSISELYLPLFMRAIWKGLTFRLCLYFTFGNCACFILYLNTFQYKT